MADRACRHALHLTMVREAAANMPALLVHRVSDASCGRRDDDEHEGRWSVVFPAATSLRRVVLCDTHFALFILDSTLFEVTEVPVDGDDS